MKLPPPPKGLRASGRALWASLLADYDLSGHERVQLLQAARVADLLDDLAAVVAVEGVTVVDPVTAASRPSPLVIEMRQQRLTLARLIAALRVPDEQEARPQRRSIRGAYGARR